MRKNAAAIVGLAVCIPCLIPVLLAVGIGAGTFSAVGAWFTDSSFVLGAAGVTAVAFSLLAWGMYTRRGAETACETDSTPTADDDGPRRTHQVAGSPRGEPRTWAAERRARVGSLLKIL